MQADLVKRITATPRQRRGADPGAARHRAARQPGLRGEPGAGGDQTAVPAAGDRPAAAGRRSAGHRPALCDVVGDRAERPRAPARRSPQNLITNALKYSSRPEGAGRAHATTGAALADRPGRGPGIDPVDQERIFNEFERLSRTDAPGSGLGLSIVRRACEQLGHEVELASARGTRFVLPGAAAADAQRLPDARSGGRVGRPHGPAVDLAGRLVLVIENDPGMREAFGMLLRELGHGGRRPRAASTPRGGGARAARSRTSC